MRSFLATTAFLLQASGWAGAEGACLRYEPAVVELSGRVVLRTFPGPPNYESIKKGDRAERQALLRLNRPICVEAEAKNQTGSENERDQRTVTLVPGPGLRTERYAGARVRVRGTLFHAHTGHHRTPILIDVKRITRVDAQGVRARGSN